MANEYMLKVMVDGLRNLAADNEKLCRYLNLRAKLKGSKEEFKGAPYKAPAPKLRDAQSLQAKAADLVTQIADNNVFAVLSVGGKPSNPDPLKEKLEDSDFLRLMIDWGSIQSAVYKAMLRLYGQVPTPVHEPTGPGPVSEERLWREIVGWLQKIADDTDLYSAVQKIVRKDVDDMGPDSSLPPLVRMEVGVHRVTLDIMTIAGLLPYHLFHVARG